MHPPRPRRSRVILVWVVSYQSSRARPKSERDDIILLEDLLLAATYWDDANASDVHRSAVCRTVPRDDNTTRPATTAALAGMRRVASVALEHV